MPSRKRILGARRIRRAAWTSEEEQVKTVMASFSREVGRSLTRLVREYFTGARRKLVLTSRAKVVARLEVRWTGHYLDVSLSEVGGDGKVIWLAARNHR